MLKFEKTDENVFTKLGGTVDDICTDLIICIGTVHKLLQEKSPEAAKELRESIELFCKRGTRQNKVLFEFFGDSEYLKKTAEDVHKENMEGLKATAREFGKMMRELADDD